MAQLSPEELTRYSRHLILPEFGMESQLRLKSASVLVVGCGGLGAPLLQYLVAAGVGRIGIIDQDTIDRSNLQRQVLFSDDDIGLKKVEVAIRKLSRQNPNIKFEPYDAFLTTENAMEIIDQYDIVADGTDNFPTRYLVNDACVLLDKVNVYGSIFQFEGQVSVFNALGKDGTRGPNYRDIFPTPPPPGMVPSCAEGGVLGVLPGLIGCMQANEVIKVLANIGDILDGRLFLFDAAAFDSRMLKIQKDPDNPVNGKNPSISKLIDYDEFCGITPNDISSEKDVIMKEITVSELRLWQESGKEHQLIDVRKAYEVEIAEMGGEFIPQSEIMQRVDEIKTDIPVVIHCRSGKRSGDVILEIEQKYGMKNLYNLKGGILAWSDEIDPTVAKY